MDHRIIVSGDPLEPSPLLSVAREQNAVDELFSATYEELRRLASSVRRNDRNATLSPTTLVNEAWLKLAGSHGIAIESALHFKRIAARAMRQVLVEAARRRQALRRGGESALVTFDEDLDCGFTDADEVLALNDALNELARVNPRQALVVETRFFGGLAISETAQLLQISEATVLRDWRAARAWLAVELQTH
ncbi:MAG TPA: ECF-type sigma factor [Gemmatimonadaceae bacterium]|nr:ECF-type sigma factor [Gemmatimonadaceae bacterium]